MSENRPVPCGRETDILSSVTAMYRINPLRDPRWAEMVERHRLRVIHRDGSKRIGTYGYEPVVAALTKGRPHEAAWFAVVCSAASR